MCVPSLPSSRRTSFVSSTIDTTAAENKIISSNTRNTHTASTAIAANVEPSTPKQEEIAEKKMEDLLQMQLEELHRVQEHEEASFHTPVTSHIKEYSFNANETFSPPPPPSPRKRRAHNILFPMFPSLIARNQEDNKEKQEEASYLFLPTETLALDRASKRRKVNNNDVSSSIALPRIQLKPRIMRKSTSSRSLPALKEQYMFRPIA